MWQLNSHNKWQVSAEDSFPSPTAQTTSTLGFQPCLCSPLQLLGLKCHCSCELRVPCPPTACYIPIPNASTRFLCGLVVNLAVAAAWEKQDLFFQLTFLHGCATPVLAPCTGSLGAGARSCSVGAVPPLNQLMLPKMQLRLKWDPFTRQGAGFSWRKRSTVLSVLRKNKADD